MKQRIFSLFTALCLCLTLLPTAAFAEGEDSTALQGDTDSTNYYGIDTINEVGDGIKYLDANGKEQTYKGDYTTVTSETTTWGTSTSDTWYVVEPTDSKDGITINGTVTLAGDVHLILCDGAKLTVTGGINGYNNDDDCYSMTIYAQSEDTGKLTVSGGFIDNNPNINGMCFKSLTVNGGSVSVTVLDATTNTNSNYKWEYGIRVYETLTINGGMVTSSVGGGAEKGTYGIRCRYLIVTDGEVKVVKDADEHQNTVYEIYNRGSTISGGKFIGDICVYATTGTEVSLIGGDYKKLSASNKTGYIKLTELLGSGYAYQSTVGEKPVYKLADLKDETSIENVTVVKCSHDSYSKGKCEYCGTECEHKNITEDGKCDCGAEFVAKLTGTGKSLYYLELPQALEKAYNDGEYNTVTLLASVWLQITEWYSLDGIDTLDLDGKILSRNTTANSTTPGAIHLSGTEAGTLTIKNGTVTNPNDSGTYGICHESSIDLILENVTVSGAEAALKKSGSGKLTIKGGTFNGGIVYSGEWQDLLADGYAFADGNGTLIELSDMSSGLKTVKVVKHDHAPHTDGTCKYCGKTIVAQIGTTYYTDLTTAITAANANNTITLLASVTGDFTCASKSFTLDLNGKTLSSLTVSGTAIKVKDGVGGGKITLTTSNRVKVIDLLESGHAFKDDDNNWYDSTHNKTATSVTDAEVKPVPITGVSIAADNTTLAYGYADAPTFTATPTGTVANASVTYTWYVNNDEQIEIGSSFTFPTGKSVTAYKVKCDAAVDGYVVTSDEITVTVNKATPTVTTALTAAVTYGKTVENGDIQGAMNVGGTFVWQNVTSYGDVTNGTPKKLTATFTPTDTTNYNSVDVNVSVTVNKATYGDKTASGSAKYGNSNTVDLSGLIMPGGTATASVKTDTYSIMSDTEIVDLNKLQFTLANDAALVGKTAEIEVSVSDCTNYKDYTIIVTLTVNDKLTPTVTAPTAKTLTYNGSEQTLINAATTTGGTLQYSLNNSTWSAELPKAKNADTYTVYYKVVGNDDYADVAANSISVTIGKKAVTVKPKSYTITKGNTIPTFELTYAGLVGEDTLLPTGHLPSFTCFEADGTTAVSTSTAAGSYTITWTNSGDADFSNSNYTVSKETTGTLTINNKPSSGGGGGSSSNTTSTTVKNPDGSTTTTVTDKKTGTVTETTTPTGTASTTVTDKNGNSTTTVSVSKRDAQSGETVTLPVDEVTAGKSEDAQEITVNVPSGGATVEIPVKNPTPGTVIVIVDKDGNETILPGTKQTENGVSVTLSESATIKVIENSKDFSDVKSSDYFDKAVDWASSRGITGGNSATTFGPHDSCTRAQLVTFLWRAAGQPEAKSESGMSDVATNSYYTDAVAWAFENGIVGGYGNGLFGSDDTITREQMAVILYRFAQHTGMDTTQGGMSVREYKDYPSISDYAVTAIQWAVNAGVMQGYDGNLMPGQPCTRAQIVTMLYRLLGK